MTVVRANVIAERTGSLEMGIAKALLIEQLKDKLANGVAHFIYTKRSNKYGEVELREAWGTTNPSLAQKHINGNGVSRELFKTTAYFDVEKGAWRSFRWESIIKVF